MERKVAIITGGSRGIGAAVTKRFAKDGYNVVFNYNRAKEAGEAVAKECNDLGVKAVLMQMDAGDRDDCKYMTSEAMRIFGRIDVLVNNAGIDGKVAPLPDFEEEEFERIIHTNLMSTFYMTKYVSICMIESGRGGSIISLSSITAKYGSSSNSAYCASKAAIDGFTRSAAKDLAKYNINVNTVAPGVTDTDMVKNLPRFYKDQMKTAVRFGRFCQPEEIAGAVAFFARDEARYATGQMLVVDGMTNL